MDEGPFPIFYHFEAIFSPSVEYRGWDRLVDLEEFDVSMRIHVRTRSKRDPDRALTIPLSYRIGGLLFLSLQGKKENYVRSKAPCIMTWIQQTRDEIEDLDGHSFQGSPRCIYQHSSQKKLSFAIGRSSKFMSLVVPL